MVTDKLVFTFEPHFLRWSFHAIRFEEIAIVKENRDVATAR